ncbi:hypothetical protein GC167_09000 [bacterium]|nr:hypothetical protein [bacterium]
MDTAGSPQRLRSPFGSKFLVFWVFIGLVASQGCYYDNYEDLYEDIGGSCDTTSLSYGAEIAPLLGTQCGTSGCHDAQTQQSGLDLTTYGDASAIALDGRLMGRVSLPTGSGGAMPPSGQLDPCSLDHLRQWVALGAPNN